MVEAWHAIRRNAETSQQEKTKQKARKFGEKLPANLRDLSARLNKGYCFEPAYGATPPKGGGKPGKRPLVIAPLEDRIVQRAILDVLQDAKEIGGVQRVLQTPTSVGGIRGRGVGHAIALFDERVKAGDRYVAGSDISGFFTRISPKRVIAFLEGEGVEPAFVQLVEKALTVELSNADRLSEEDRKLFPTGEDGVAQGCPLSALAGNIVLENFDRDMNVRGITCIRYIDDFIVTGKSLSAVQKAMEAAKRILAGLNMDIYDPITSPNKAFIGEIGREHVFLGYKLLPGLYPPADAACEKLLRQIQGVVAEGQRSISKAVSDRTLTSQDRCYAQTLVFGGEKRKFAGAECGFFLTTTADTGLHEATFPLTPADFAAVNPNSGTAPVFRTARDADLTTAIYARLPVLVRHAANRATRAVTPWPVKYLRMFDMTNDSHLFRTRAELEADGWYPVAGGRWKKGEEREAVPLYEGKMVQAFDHRAASVVVNELNLKRPAQPEDSSLEQRMDPAWLPSPQFFVDLQEVNKQATDEWMLTFKSITAPTNMRTMIAGLIPLSGVGNSMAILLAPPENARSALRQP